MECHQVSAQPLSRSAEHLLAQCNADEDPYCVGMWSMVPGGGCWNTACAEQVCCHVHPTFAPKGAAYVALQQKQKQALEGHDTCPKSQVYI